MSFETLAPAGFKYIKIFHLTFGISYFGYYSNSSIKFITLMTTAIFLIMEILANVPCFFYCTFDTKELFGKAGLSPNFMSFVVVYLDLYHVVMSALICMSRGSKIREFFTETHDYCRNFGVKLVSAQKKKLTATAVRLVTYNVLHMIGEILMLTLLVEHKLARPKKNVIVNLLYVPSAAGSKNSTRGGSYNDDGESLIELSYSFWYHLSLILKVFSVVYSKIIETLLVYIATYLSMVLKRLESRFDKFVYTSKGGRSIEVAKVAFIEVQNLIKGADEVFSHTAFDPLFVNVLIVLIGLFVAIDGVTRRRTLDHNDWHELYNSFSSFFAIYMCCKSHTTFLSLDSFSLLSLFICTFFSLFICTFFSFNLYFSLTPLPLSFHLYFSIFSIFSSFSLFFSLLSLFISY